MANISWNFTEPVPPPPFDIDDSYLVLEDYIDKRYFTQRIPPNVGAITISDIGTGTVDNFLKIGRKIWLYEDVAPNGWTILDTCIDGLLAVKGSTIINYNNTGGTVTTYGQYMIHTFTSSGTFTPKNMSGVADVLVVAGGGGGAGGQFGGGGGGAGGFVYTTSVPVSVNVPITVTVGAGGAGGPLTTNPTSNGFNGGNSSFGSISATGGGGGGGWNFTTSTPNAKSGGSGGGGGGGNQWYPTGGLGILGQGNNGGLGGWYYHNVDPANGGGGGGAGNVGGPANYTNGVYTEYVGGDGGAGLSSTIYDGTARWYAGGGGGGAWYSGRGGYGGIGGGGAGSVIVASSALANTGGGGGGGGRFGSGTLGGSGGSGIVIVRCLIVDFQSFTTTYNTAGGSGAGTWMRDSHTHTTSDSTLTLENISSHYHYVCIDESLLGRHIPPHDYMTGTFGIYGYVILTNLNSIPYSADYSTCGATTEAPHYGYMLYGSDITPTIGKTSNIGSTTVHSHGITNSGGNIDTWRPLSNVGIIIGKDAPVIIT